MGATGASGSGVRHARTREDRVFGIRNARQLEEGTKIKDAGFTPGKDDITIAAHSDEGKDIVFQFKLLKGDKMKITAYDPNVPSKGRVSVSAERPSLDAVISNPKSTSVDKQNAMKIRDMVQRTDSGIKESSLGRIANELKKKKRKRGQLA